MYQEASVLSGFLAESEMFINAKGILSFLFTYPKSHSPHFLHNLGSFTICVHRIRLIWGHYLSSCFGAPECRDFRQAFHLVSFTNL